jgi:hypothetical protein
MLVYDRIEKAFQYQLMQLFCNLVTKMFKTFVKKVNLLTKSQKFPVVYSIIRATRGLVPAKTIVYFKLKNWCQVLSNWYIYSTKPFL